MNSQKLARATIVLDRRVHEDLSYVAGRMGVSRSALVRDVLSEPVALMAKWVRSVPDDVTPAVLADLTQLMEGDITELVEAHTARVGVGHV
jgi:hypothetical protein